MTFPILPLLLLMEPDIALLAHDTFQVREAAMARLCKSPTGAARARIVAVLTDDPEVRWRCNEIAKRHPSVTSSRSTIRKKLPKGHRRVYEWFK